MVVMEDNLLLHCELYYVVIVYHLSFLVRLMPYSIIAAISGIEICHECSMRFCIHYTCLQICKLKYIVELKMIGRSNRRVHYLWIRVRYNWNGLAFL